MVLNPQDPILGHGVEGWREAGARPPVPTGTSGGRTAGWGGHSPQAHQSSYCTVCIAARRTEGGANANIGCQVPETHCTLLRGARGREGTVPDSRDSSGPTPFIWPTGPKC